MIVRQLDASFDMRFGYGLNSYFRDSDTAIGQNIKTRLLLIRGEWFLDLNEGTPWRSILGVKPINTLLDESLIRQRILGTVGVTGITQFSMVYDPISRKATVKTTVSTIYSTLVTVEAGI